MTYGIYHVYDVDGSFGDAVSKEELVATCQSKEMAENYAKHWDNTHAYAKPYSYLYCGYLYVKPLGEVPMITTENEMESPWKWAWCPEGYVEVKGDEDEDC